MLVETVLSLFWMTIVYLPEDYVHPKTGYECNVWIRGYYSFSEEQIYVCEWQWERVIYHELGHHFFEKVIPESHKKAFIRYVNILGIPNTYSLEEWVFYHEIFANSF